MLFFVILGGVKSKSPLNHTYFLQADTSGITGAKDVSQWTYLYICGEGNTDCGKAHPALPFGAAWDGNADEAPSALIGKYGGNTTSYYFYYMWRFGWVFYLLALFLEICAFFTSFLACCGRLGAGIASLITLLAFVFLSVAVSLMTATFVKARKIFRADDRDAKLGTYAFGFSWAALAALFLSLILLCMGTASGRRQRAGAPDGAMGAAAVPSRRGWGRRRNNSRRSVGGGGRVSGSFAKTHYEDGSNA